MLKFSNNRCLMYFIDLCRDFLNFPWQPSADELPMVNQLLCGVSKPLPRGFVVLSPRTPS